MKRSFLAIIITSLITFSSIAQQWAPVGSRGITATPVNDVKLAFIDTIPYIAFKDPYDNYKISVMKFDGTKWIFVGSPGFTPSNPAAFSSTNQMRFEFKINQNTPYVAFFDNSDSNKVSVMNYTGGSWQYIGQKISPAYGAHLSLAFDGSVPYVSYQYKGGNIQVQKYVAGSWSIVGPASIAPVPGIPSSGRVTSIAVLSGTPYLTTYAPTAITTFKTFKFNGTNWVDVSPGDALNPGSYAYHSIVNNGKLYLAFSRFYSSSEATLLEYNGTSWDSIGTPGMLFSKDVKVAFSQSSPFLSTTVSLSNPGVYLSRFDGTNWKSFGSFHTQLPSGDITLGFARDSIPFVAYVDGNVAGKVSVVRFNNNPPEINSVDSISGCMSSFPDTVLVTIADEDTNSVELIVTSSDQVLLPNSQLQFLEDTTANRWLKISPVNSQSGTAILQIIAVDNGGKKDTILIKVKVFEEPELTLDVQDILCRDDIVGSITAKASGQHRPFSYMINNGPFQLDSNFNNLLPGAYQITIEDTNGCQNTSDSVILANPLKIDISGVSVQNEVVGNDGILTINATGGTGTLTYSLDNINFQLSPVFNGLTAGVYTIYVKDANGCMESTVATISAGVGIKEVSDLEFKIYPNPSKGQFTTYKNFVAPAKLFIYNSLGKLVFEEVVSKSNQQFRLPKELANGLYTVQLIENKRAFTVKLILEQ